MRKIVFTIVLFAVFSCKNGVVEKPDNLIEKEVMVNILYDLALIQSAESNNPNAFSQNEIKVNDLIYKKYNIDSASFAQSNRYYASDPHNYQKLFKQVSEKITAKKEALNQQSLKETGKTIVPSDVPSIQ